MCEEGAGPAGEGPAAPRSKQAEVWTQSPEPSGGETLKCAEMELTDSAGFHRGKLTELVLMIE